MHSERAAVPPAVPWPAATPSAPLASCSVISPHAVRPLPPAFTAAAEAAGVATEEAAGAATEEVAAGFAPAGAVDGFAVPQLARSTQPTVASRALLVPVPIMMISFAGRGYGREPNANRVGVDCGWVVRGALAGRSRWDDRSEDDGRPAGLDTARAGRVDGDDRQARQNERVRRWRRKERVDVHHSARGCAARARVPGQRRRTRREGEWDPDDEGPRGGGGELHGDDVRGADCDGDRAERGLNRARDCAYVGAGGADAGGVGRRCGEGGHCADGQPGDQQERRDAAA